MRGGTVYSLEEGETVEQATADAQEMVDVLNKRKLANA